MSRLPVMLLLALVWVIIVLFTAGCTAPVQQQIPMNTVIVTSATATIPVTAETPLPAPVVTAATTAADVMPEIRVDGYWTFPQGRDTTGNPVPIMVHTEAFNTGTQDAREVRTSSNFYYGSRMICHDTIYLGSLAAGGHVGRDTMVTCTLPSPFTDRELEVRFENMMIGQ
ncbi:MAG TPA: hypothetical protein VHN82_02340 [Methanoregula sp.]|nr:hypothetical protein [Methanoregula sp.]